MRTFAVAYLDESIVQQVVARLPWGHNTALLDKLQILEERLRYAQKAIENGWSRDVLILQITTGLYNRIGGAMTNFQQVLPPSQSDLVQQILKSPYNFEFLSLASNVQERDLERGLIAHIKDFLMELGIGFGCGSFEDTKLGRKNRFSIEEFGCVIPRTYALTEVD